MGIIKFKKWVQLEEMKQKIKEAAGIPNDDFPNHILAFIASALNVPVGWIEKAEWGKVIHAFYVVCTKFPQLDLPIVQPSPLTQGQEESWEYEGRTWHVYSHILAKHYGWTIEYISQLQVGEALAKIQEILTDEQLEREFQHSLSEIAYPYNSQTKKSEFHPLQRPHWMRPKIKETPKIKIPAIYMPIGVVDYDSLPEELKPKEFIN
jgi:hypothetical protein